jgi:hypothetical protein
MMNEPLILDAASLSDWQACSRRYLLARSWLPPRWSPRRLFMACLRQGILSLSRGESPLAVAADARARFLQSSANPGLDVPDPYPAAKEWSSLLEVLLHVLARTNLPSNLTSPASIALNSMLTWSPLTHVSGQMLHRWITVDHWSDRDIPGELHSWYVIGDIAALGLLMTIHVIEIGQIRNGKRASPWLRGWRHPGLASLPMRFRRKDGKSFSGWKPVYFTDAQMDAEEWVDQLFHERAAQELLHTVTSTVPSESARARVCADILQEAARIRAAEGSWESQPMARNACDGWTPCPFQECCYREGVVDVASLGFRTRTAPHPAQPGDSIVPFPLAESTR